MASKTLEQVTKEIEQVLALNDSGQTIKQISQALELDEDYIYSILICSLHRPHGYDGLAPQTPFTAQKKRQGHMWEVNPSACALVRFSF